MKQDSTLHDTTSHHSMQQAPAGEHGQAGHQGEHAQTEGFTFNAMFNENLGDHGGFYLFSYHLADLPYIFVDNGSFEFFPNVHALEASGKYELHAGHAVKKDGSHVQLDLSPTNFVMFQWISMIVVIALFIIGNRSYKKSHRAPKGIGNALEMLTLMIRDTVVRPNIPNERLVSKYLPYFLSVFFFIYAMNLVGLLPGGHTATSAIGTTAGLAITAFVMVNIIIPVKAMGAGGAFKSFLHHLLGGAPWWLAPIMVPIEVVGVFTKPFALAIRLFANMSSGHIILFTLLGFIFFFNTVAVSPVVTLFSIFIYFLEILVTFLQAYIFTMLTAVFTGLVLGDHADDHH
ncbi:MAG: F0F1 ATP synthase subunit A [Ignavibacteria bacterium]